MRKILKLVGLILGGLIVLALLAFVGAGLAGGARMNRVYDITPETITLPTDEASIARGEHLAKAFCAHCHGENLGGKVMVDEPGMVTIYAPNITTGSGGFGSLPVPDLVRAMRHAVDIDGTPLFIMPAELISNLSEEDFGSVIAYIKQAPPVDHSVPPPKVSFVAQVMLTAGAVGQIFPAEYIDHHQPFPEMPPVGANAEYGKYLTRLGGCLLCHGSNLAGGIIPPNAPPGAIPLSPNLTPAGELAGWTEDDFLTTLKTGTTPSGHHISPEVMPWDIYKNFDDDELRGIWLYLKSLPPVETPGK